MILYTDIGGFDVTNGNRFMLGKILVWGMLAEALLYVATNGTLNKGIYIVNMHFFQLRFSCRTNAHL